MFKMARFKVGDRVMEKNNCFGNGDKIGIVRSVNTFCFLSYSVAFRGMGLFEYHKGELKGVKK